MALAKRNLTKSQKAKKISSSRYVEDPINQLFSNYNPNHMSYVRANIEQPILEEKPSNLVGDDGIQINKENCPTDYGDQINVVSKNSVVSSHKERSFFEEHEQL